MTDDERSPEVYCAGCETPLDEPHDASPGDAARKRRKSR